MPPTYSARPGGSVESARNGVPVTLTGLPNDTAMSIARPAPYVPFASGEDTVSTRGAMPSMPIIADAPSDPASPGSGSVRSAALPAASRIVEPLGRDRALLFA